MSYLSAHIDKGTAASKQKQKDTKVKTKYIASTRQNHDTLLEGYISICTCFATDVYTYISYSHVW